MACLPLAVQYRMRSNLPNLVSLHLLCLPVEAATVCVILSEQAPSSNNDPATDQCADGSSEKARVTTKECGQA